MAQPALPPPSPPSPSGSISIPAPPSPAPAPRPAPRRRSPLRRRLLAPALAAGVALAGPLVAHGDDAAPQAHAMVVDLHVDIPWQVHVKGRALDLHEGHARLEALKAGDYGGIVFPIYLPDGAHKDGAHIEDADAIFETIEKIIARNPVFLPLRAGRSEPGRITTFLAIEGAGAFAADIPQIDRFIARGLRLVSPVHAKNSPLASSATGAPVTFGLTELGKTFCNRVYDHGALIDVSHVSDAAFADIQVLAAAHHAPIVATHSNARALASHPRNLTDEQLRVIGATGGVAGVNFHSAFVTGTSDATLADVVRQVEHMVKVAGIDHVAVGSDFDGGIRPAAGLEDASGLPALEAALLRAGMSYPDVLKVFSLNALRVLAWKPTAPGP